MPERSSIVPESSGSMPAEASAPAESDAAIVATPNDLAGPPMQLTEAEVSEPGFGR